MRKYWLAAVCTGLCVTVPTVASANTAVGCWGIDRSGKRFVETSVKDFGELDYNGLMLVLNGWKKHANALGYDYAECNVLGTREKTIVSLEQRRNWNLDHSQSRSAWMDEFATPAPPRKPDRISITGPSSRPPSGPSSGGRKRKIETASTDAPAAPKYVEVAGPDGPIRLSPEVAARNQAAADDYRRKMDAFARAKAEHERTLALHQQSQANAAAEQQAYQREVAAAAERVAAYQVALADQSRKSSAASTNDDPNTCITRPEFRSNDGFAGNTSASVINGCPQKVDIVLCLKRTAGDWTCGAQFGILTQGKMSYATRNATGEIFVDAITYGGGGKLKRPAGM